MKKTLLSLALVLSIVSAQATGSLPINSPQTGVVSYSGTNLIATTSFSPVFSSVPVMAFYGSVTNILPFTTSITTSNFTLTITTNQSGTTFGGSVVWSANLGYPRIQTGTNSVLAATPTNVTFAVPYAYTPVIALSDSVTNATVTAVTATGFTLTVNANEAVNWNAFGTAAAPGASVVTY